MKYNYDAVVIGGGAAGLSAAGLASSLGAKTLLVEQDRLGGDCTWTGCVPSKALLSAAKKVKVAADVTGSDPQQLANFSEIMQGIADKQEHLYKDADSPEQLAKFGVTTKHAKASLQDKRTVKLAGDEGTEEITTRFIFIATGAKPAVPPIEGVESVAYKTSESLFSLQHQPDRLAVVGGGPVGVEMAQAFTQLGSDVVLFETNDRIVSQSHHRLSNKLASILSDQGVSLQTDTQVEQFTPSGSDEITIKASSGETHQVDEVLLATGRSPNVEQIGLDRVGVDYGNSGVTTNQYGQTNVGNVYAIGDVTNSPRFTHQAEQEAKSAVMRALYKYPLSKDNPVPYVIYTDMELAGVGQTWHRLQEDTTDHDTYRFPYNKLDRAITDGPPASQGEVILYTNAGKDTLIGAEVLGPRAGELISELSVAIEHGLSLQDLSQTVHPYPSYGLGIRRAADQYLVQNQPSWLLRLLNTVFGYQGDMYQPDKGKII